jgi:hypothetical protein
MCEIVIGRTSVSPSAIAISTMPARNLPTTSCQRGTGKVSSTSSVPARRSSAHCRIASADTTMIKSRGIHSNSGRRSAMPRAKNFSTQKNIASDDSRNAARKITAMAELKYALSSFLMTVVIMALPVLRAPPGRGTRARESSARA